MDEDLYFIDTRNADPRDHRVGRPGAIVPARSVAVAPVATASRVYAPPPAVTYPGYPPGGVYGAAGPMYAPAPGYGPPWGPLGGLLGGLNLGDVVKLAADAFAAFKSLPAAPVPTGDVATDVANMDLHMSTLAKDAQTRKQIEYAGEIAGRFGRGFGAW